MTAHLGTIVFKAKGQQIPDKYLEKVMAANPSGVGFALRENDDDKFVSLQIGGGTFPLKEVQEIQTTFKDNDLFFFFHNYPEKYKEEDLQPIVLFKDKADKALLVGMAEGDFSNYMPNGSDHSNEYFMFNKYLIPKLSRMFKDKSIDYLMNELNDPIVRQDFDNLGGNLVLFSGDGKVFKSMKSDYGYPWGWTSDNHNYVEETETKPVSKAMQFLKNRKAAAENKPATPPPTDNRSTPVRTADVTHPPDVATEFETITVPRALWQSHKAVKRFLQERLGSVPKNWTEYETAIWTRKKHKDTVVLKDFKDLPKAIASVEPIQQPVKKAVTEERLPLMSPKVVESVVEDFKELDKSSNRLPVSPADIQLLEHENPSFWEKTGIPRDTTDTWPFETFLDLAQKYPKAAAILACNYRADSLANRPAEEVYEAPDDDDVDTSGSGVVSEEPVKKYVHPSKRKAP